LTFRRAVQVDSMSEMRLQIEASAAKTATFPARLLIVIATLAALSVVVGATRLSLRNEH
jgi:hypothetical protein